MTSAQMRAFACVLERLDSALKLVEEEKLLAPREWEFLGWWADDLASNLKRCRATVEGALLNSRRRRGQR